jgi:large repetitive protein
LTASRDIIVNDYAEIIVAARAGTSIVAVDDASKLKLNDVVLVWRPVGIERAALGDPAPISLSASDALGRSQFARVLSVSAAEVDLDRPLEFDVPKDFAQIVRVPEYSTVSISNGALVQAKSWDGRVGGIVVLLVQGRATIDGIVSAKAAGGRGGRFFSTGVLLTGCADQEGLPNLGYAASGEGVFVAGYDGSGDPAKAPGGRANRANGAGGGNCHNSGGGGGGSAGAGGIGGLSWSGDGSRAVGGLGGAALAASLADRLFMGGGGGAGETDHRTNRERPSSGAVGGGVVLIRAMSIDGSGSISADGADAEAAAFEGGGGGGAGGSVFLESESDVRLSVSAVGGTGADTSEGFSPGGGGGGGRIRVTAQNKNASTKVNGGVSGKANGAGGASDGASGVVE